MKKAASTLDCGRGVFLDLDAAGQPVRVVADSRISESQLLLQAKRAGWRITVGPFSRVASEDAVDFDGAEVLFAQQATDAEMDPLGFAVRAEEARVEADENYRYGLDAHASARRSDKNTPGKKKEAAIDLAASRSQPTIKWAAATQAFNDLLMRDPGNRGLRMVIRASASQPGSEFVSYEGLMTFARTASGGGLTQSTLDAITDVAVAGLRTAKTPEAMKAHARAAALATLCTSDAAYDKVVREYGLERDNFTRSLLRAYAQEVMDKSMDVEPMGSLNPADDADGMAIPGDDAPMGDDMDMLDKEPMDPMADEPVVVTVPDPHDEGRMLEVSIAAKDPVPEDADAIDEAAAAPLPSDASEEFEVQSSGASSNCGPMDGCDEDGSAKDPGMMTRERFKAASLAIAEARVAALSGARRVSAGVLSDGTTTFYISSLGKQRNRTAKITKEETTRRCAALGLTDSAITSAVLDGNGLQVAGWSISASSDGLSVGFGRVGSQVPRILALTSLETQVADFRRAAASDARGVYRVSLDVPGMSISERRAAAKRIISDLSDAMKPIASAIDTAKGEVVLAYHGHPTKAALSRLAAVARDRFGLNIRGQYQPFMGPAQPQSVAGQPMKPMTNPMQTVNTSAGNQQAMVDNAAMSPADAAKNVAKPMQPSSAGSPGLDPLANPLQAPKTAADAKKCEACGKKQMPWEKSCKDCKGKSDDKSDSKSEKEPAAKKKAQEDEDMPPADDVPMDDMPIAPEEDVLGEDPMMGGEALPPVPMDPGMGSAMDPAMGAPGMPGPGGGMSIDGLLTPEDGKLLEAAVTHYRNTGKLPMEATTAFLKEYPHILEKFGAGNSAQETSIPRQMVELHVLGLISAAWSKPAALDASGVAPGPGAAPGLGA